MGVGLPAQYDELVLKPLASVIEYMRRQAWPLNPQKGWPRRAAEPMIRLDDVIKFGFGLGDLSISEGSLCMKKPQVGVLCPKIRELDCDFGDVLG